VSFDLKIKNGDIRMGSNGDLDKIQDVEKLVQDILKLLMTEIGSNPFNPWYGSSLSQSMIGSGFDGNFLTTLAEGQIRSGLETIMALQREQSAQQKVSAGELLASIKGINVQRNQTDPTFFTITLEILTKSLKVVPVTFDITL